MSQSQYAPGVLQEVLHKFVCSHISRGTANHDQCTEVWDWFMVRHVAALSMDEEHELEDMMGT